MNNIFYGIDWVKDYDRTKVASRAMVQLMRDRGDLPQNMSDKRFNNIADGIQEAMLATLKDYKERRKKVSDNWGENILPENFDLTK